ncbi:Zinc finger protein 782, partial [Araneus ventricosus]
MIAEELGHEEAFSVNNYTQLPLETGENSYDCQECGKHFSQEKDLEVHPCTHMNKRPHVCEICGRKYSRKDSLKRHLILHTNATPFVCEVCGKKFVQKKSLRLHLLSHVSTDSYSTLQAENFSQNVNLKHLYSLVKEKTHTCD